MEGWVNCWEPKHEKLACTRAFLNYVAFDRKEWKWPKGKASRDEVVTDFENTANQR
jgi:hypothetical protein